MIKLYQVEVFHSHNPVIYENSGELIEVNGVQMVRMPHGTIVPITDRWFASRADSKRAAADAVEKIQRDLGELAAKLRAEAEVIT